MKKFFLPLSILFLTSSLFAQHGKMGREKKDNGRPIHKAAVTISPKFLSAIESIESKMVHLDAGNFIEGCTEEQDSDCYFWETPPHVVRISSFDIGKYDITQKEWEAIMGTTPWYVACDECPVVNVSWYDAQIFTNKLNQATGKFYRLPTEAEWEYAARGGNRSRNFKYSGSSDVNSVAWNGNNSNSQAHPVGLKKPNELGLYDMNGNVWQWCSDWFDNKYYSDKNNGDNPTGPRIGSHRAVRGGSWWADPSDCRVSNRDRYPPDASDDDVGFRVVREQ